MVLNKEQNEPNTVDVSFLYIHLCSNPSVKTFTSKSIISTNGIKTANTSRQGAEASAKVNALLWRHSDSQQRCSALTKALIQKRPNSTCSHFQVADKPRTYISVTNMMKPYNKLFFLICQYSISVNTTDYSVGFRVVSWSFYFLRY